MTNRQKNPLLYRVIRTIFYALFMTVYRPRIVNKSLIPKEGRAVLAGNHKHALDPILVDCCTNRTVHTLAKKDLHDGAFGWLFRGVGTIPVDLHAAHNPAALDKSVEYLKNDCIINVSPEAKRNYTDQILLPFKYGAVVMAKRTQSRIIPYAITGDYRFRSRNLQIKFGEPLDVTALTVEEANTLLYNTVKELLVQEMDIQDKTHADGSD
ncbi:MAG: 1-acyl-sn-glycerol-3-phosphate acyltransferase [Lachnospiraceae bacterium]|nr:1-acyl-sn-glycerol-3-phosphate acyltransferase [Lachnospiraceae bacterium]